MNEENKQNVKIAVIETKIQNLEEKVDTVISNHLPHIQARVDKIENKLALWSGAIIILGIILPYFLDKLFK